VQKAIEFAQRSADLDPNFAPAWAALADSLVYENVAFGTPHDEARARAFSAAQTALRLDPKLSDGHLAMGRVLGELDWNWKAADVELQSAVALDPNNVLALDISSGYALIQGRLKDAQSFGQRAAALDAVSVDAIGSLGDVYLADGRFADAITAYRKASELNTTHAGVHANLGLALLNNGDPAAALTEMQQETDEASREWGLALAFDALGRHSDADQALAALETRFANTTPQGVASVYACRKQPDKAFAWLDRAYQQRNGGLVSLQIDPCTRTLRTDPRYRIYLAKLNLAG
jgi:tetratricopeptide (TPR) repeat protein